jgi:hypothetical protein
MSGEIRTFPQIMDIILRNNLLTFQEVGFAMGTKPAPSYACIFMARRINNMIIALAQKPGSTLSLFKRFLLFDEMNKQHKSIKFTMNHTSPPNEAVEDRCNCKYQSSIPFIDVLGN